MTADEKKIFLDAIRTYGATSQITMVFEEMSELQKALCKYLRGYENFYNVANIAEEIADVGIMLDQMTLFFTCGNYVEAVRAEKVRRLEKRLEEAKHENRRPG